MANDLRNLPKPSRPGAAVPAHTTTPKPVLPVRENRQCFRAGRPCVALRPGALAPDFFSRASMPFAQDR